MLKTASLAVFFLMIFLIACKSPNSPYEDKTMTLEIIGTVTNARTGSLIANALIQVIQGFKAIDQTKTDQEGRYSLKLIVDRGGYRDGVFTLIASAVGYTPIYLHQGYSVRRTTEVQIANFQLELL